MLKRKEAHVVILGGGFGGPRGGPGARRTRRARHADRPQQPPPVSAAAVSGRHGGAGRARRLGADPPAAVAAAERHRADGRRAAHRRREEARAARGPAHRLRLPDPRHRHDARLFRPRQLGGLRARAEDDRRGARHPPAHPARVRGGRAGDRDRGAPRLDHLRGHRRRPDRRRAGGRAGRDRGPHAGARLSPLRPAHDARRS